MNKYKNYFIASFFILIGIFFLIMLNNQDFIALDLKVYNDILNLRTDNLNKIMIAITHMGSTIAMIGGAFLLMIIIRKKKENLMISCNLLGVFLLNRIIKLFVSRPRPEGIKLLEASGSSFPSAHAMISTAFYGLLIYLIKQTKWKKEIKIILSTILSILIIILPFSRIYVGVHYPSDILAGFFFGLGFLIIFINLFNKIYQVPNEK